MKAILTTQEAADLLGSTADKVRRWCREEYLPAVKIGRSYRISAAALIDWWEEQGGGRLVLDEDNLSKPKLFEGISSGGEPSSVTSDKDSQPSKKESKTPRRIVRT
jgi:excisionase family DNA binding protein